MIRPILLGSSLAMVLACGGDKPVTPTAGNLTVAYSGPTTTDGALLLRVTGGAVESATAIGGYRVSSADAGGGVTRVVVTGDLNPGDLFRIAVKDISLNYAVQIEAAADRNTFGLNDPTNYGATIRK